VFRVATIYAVAAWPLVQLADLFFPALGLPDEAMTYLLIAFVSGFPLALILSWVFNLTSQGIVLDSGKEAISKAPKHDWIIVAGMISLMLLLTAYFSMQIPVASGVNTQPLLAQSIKTADENSIAVLPFKIFNDNEDDRYFADGLTDEMSNAVSMISGLRVAARTSTFGYLDSNKTIAEIGAELNVSKILEGSVRHNDVDNRIRVSASLVDVASGVQMWSKSFDREFTDLFRVQEEIAGVVADQMKLKIEINEQAYATSIPKNVDALRAYSAGQSELQKRTVAALKSALSWFQRAVELDSGYAPAYIGVANAASLIHAYGGSSKQQATSISEPAIAKAKTIAPDTAEVYAAEGLAIWQDDAGKAASLFKKAIATNPNYSSAHNWYGGVLNSLGKKEEALIHFKKSYELDPRSSVAAHNVAQSFFDLARDKEALRVIDKLIAMDPYYPGAFNLIGDLYKRRGRLDDAVVQYRKSLELAPGNRKGALGLLKASIEIRDRDLAEFAFQNLKPLGDTTEGSEWDAQIKLIDAQKELVFGNIDASIEKFNVASKAMAGRPQQKFITAELGYFSGDYPLAVSTYKSLEKDSEKLGIDIYSGEQGIGIHFAYALIQTDDVEEANLVLDKILKELDKPWRKKRQYPDDFFILSQIAMVKNQLDEGLLYLNLAINAGWTSTWILELDPAWKGLVNDERLLALKQRVDIRLSSMRNSLASNSKDGVTSSIFMR
jgi:TolB-like protein/Flp pilus assembly protein TadD